MNGPMNGPNTRRDLRGLHAATLAITYVVLSSAGCSGTGGQLENPEGCPAAAVFCEDFESHALGEAPGGPWSPDGAGTMTIDAQQVFGGSQSVRLTTTAGYDGRALLGLDDSSVFPTTHYFGRMHMYVTEASPDGVHWTMIQSSGMTEAEAEGVWDGPFMAELRYGGMHQQRLMANYETPGTYNTPPDGPASDCWQNAQTVMPQGEWACFEWEFDSETDTMRLWLDGELVEGLELGTAGQGCVNPGTNDVWYYPETFERVDLGWVDYQNFGGERELWIDDVALGFERLGCE